MCHGNCIPRSYNYIKSRNICSHLYYIMNKILKILNNNRVMTVAAEEDGVSEDGLDYLASLFQNADYKQIMHVGSYFLY